MLSRSDLLCHRPYASFLSQLSNDLRLGEAGKEKDNYRNPCTSQDRPKRLQENVKTSYPVRLLCQAGVDLSRSEVIEHAEVIHFQIFFEDSEVTNLSSSGYYNARTNHLNVDFSFQAQPRVVDENKNVRKETFQFDLHLEADRVLTHWANFSVRKEDIREFALGIVNEIARLQSQGKQIDGLILNDEDFRDLASLDGGKILKKIMELIYLLKQVNRFNYQDREHVILAPERERTVMIETGFYRSESIKFSLEVHKASQHTADSDVESFSLPKQSVARADIAPQR